MPDAPRDLDQLRAAIDDVDRRFLDLLRERRDLVAEVARWKTTHGAPVYVPELEATLLRARRDEAIAAGVSPDLMEDLLRRIMRESYRAESDHGFRCVLDEPGPVVIVGGGGAMGKLLGGLFARSGYEVRVLETGDWDRAATILAGAALVLVSVPIAVTEGVVDRLQGLMPPGAVLADVTSRKAAPLAAMLRAHAGPVVGLHPMCGPTVPTLAKQVVVRCAGRDDDACTWVFDQFRLWGASIVEADAATHDHAMALVQALRHFATFVYGQHLQEEDADLNAMLEVSSPIYRLELAMTGRLFAQDPDLYTGIVFDSPEGLALAERFLDRFARAVDLYRRDDRAEFRRQFLAVRDWFGPLADTFLVESSALLAQADDRLDRGSG